MPEGQKLILRACARFGAGMSSIHDVLADCDATDVESNRHGKSDLKRVVSMLTRLIQRTESVSEGSAEYEYKVFAKS